MSRRATLFALVALSLVGASVASAWEPIYPTRPVWSGSVPYSLNRNGSVDLGGFAGTEPEVRSGMDDWTRVSCTSLTTDYRGVTSAVPGSYEGVSTIGWIESSWRHGGSAIGVTGPRWGGGRIIESDMEMNGVNFEWTTGPGSFDTVNAYSIILHEGGHYYGLGHTDVRGSTMWPSYSGGVIGLGPDDEAGICALYPGSGSSDCTTTGCPSGEECVSGSCQPIMGDGSICSPCRRSSDCSGAGALCLGYPDGGGYCGTPCGSDADCGGDRCVNTTGGPQCVRFSGGSATCAEPPSGCRTDSECAATEICSGGACVPRPATGNDLGEACTADDECRSGLCLAGVCTQSCDWLNTTSCPAGFYCDGDGSSSCSTGYCLRGGAGAGALGDACAADTECASLFCDRGICTTPCVPGGTIGCDPGYTCQVGTLTCRGSCQRGRELGDACDVNPDCASLACATQGGDSFCTQPCDDATPCPEGFACTAAGDQSVCVPELSGLDDACTTDADCLSGICTTESGASYCTRGCDPPCPEGFACGMTETDEAVCVRTERDLGQDCDVNEDCASRLCLIDGMETYCTQQCDPEGMCPAGFECAMAGDTQVCRPVETPPARGGCGCRAASAGDLGLAGPGLVAVLALVWRRRRRR